MSDLNLLIQIQVGVDKFNSAWDGMEKKVKDSTERMNNIHAKSQKTIKDSYDMYRAGMLAGVKTLSQQEEEYSHKKTAVLVGDIHKLSKQRAEEDLKLRVAVAENDRVEQRIHKNRIERIQIETRQLRLLAQERSEVQTGGAGALIGQLGVGRDIFAEIPGLGGAASILGKLGTAGPYVAATAAVVALGAAGVKTFGLLKSSAKEAEDAEDALFAALTRSGARGGALDRLGEHWKGIAEGMARDFAMPRSEAEALVAQISGLTGYAGPRLQQLTELSIGMNKATGVALEMISKAIAKGTDPETMNGLGRLGIHLERFKTTQERINYLQKEFGGAIDETKKRMAEGVHSWDDMNNRVQEAIQDFSQPIFKELSPLWKQFGVSVSETARALGGELAPFLKDVILLAEKGLPYIDALTKSFGVLAHIAAHPIDTAKMLGSYALGKVTGYDPWEIAAERDKRTAGVKDFFAKIKDTQDQAHQQFVDDERIRQTDALVKQKTAHSSKTDLEKKAFDAERTLIENYYADQKAQQESAMANGLVTEREGKLKILSLDAEMNARLVAEARKYHQRYAQMQAAFDKDNAEKRQIDYAKQISEIDVANAQLLNYEQDFHTREKTSKTQHENAIYAINKATIDAKIAATKAAFQDTAALDTQEENLARAHAQALAAIEDADAKQRVAIEQEIQDRSVALISDPARKAKWQARLKKQRDDDRIAQIEDADERHRLSLLNEQEYQAALLRIQEDSLKQQKDLAKGLVESGLNPISQALNEQIALWQKTGGIASQVIGDIMKKLISAGENKLVASFVDGLFSKKGGGQDSAANVGSQKQTPDLAGLLGILNIPVFGDSDGPVGDAGGPIVNGKALVLADPMDMLIKLPARGNLLPMGDAGNLAASGPQISDSEARTRGVNRVLRRLQDKQKYDQRLFDSPYFKGNNDASGLEATAIGQVLDTDRAKLKALIADMLKEQHGSEDAVINELIQSGGKVRDATAKNIASNIATGLVAAPTVPLVGLSGSLGGSAMSGALGHGILSALTGGITGGTAAIGGSLAAKGATKGLLGNAFSPAMFDATMEAGLLGGGGAQLAEHMGTLFTHGFEHAAPEISELFTEQMTHHALDATHEVASEQGPAEKMKDLARAMDQTTEKTKQASVAMGTVSQVGGALATAIGGKGGAAVGSMAGLLASVAGGAAQANPLSMLLGFLPLLGLRYGGIAKAAYGMVTGPGGPLSDTVPVLTSPGEGIVNAASVSHYGGPEFIHALNRRTFAPKVYAMNGGVDVAPLVDKLDEIHQTFRERPAPSILDQNRQSLSSNQYRNRERGRTV